jgi:hypothetical protein
VSPMLAYALGVATPFVGYGIVFLTRELPSALRQIVYERQEGTSRRETCMRGWVWWVFIRRTRKAPR